MSRLWACNTNYLASKCAFSCGFCGGELLSGVAELSDYTSAFGLEREATLSRDRDRWRTCDVHSSRVETSGGHDHDHCHSLLLHGKLNEQCLALRNISIPRLPCVKQLLITSFPGSGTYEMAKQLGALAVHEEHWRESNVLVSWFSRTDAWQVGPSFDGGPSYDTSVLAFYPPDRGINLANMERLSRCLYHRVLLQTREPLAAIRSTLVVACSMPAYFAMADQLLARGRSRVVTECGSPIAPINNITAAKSSVMATRHAAAAASDSSQSMCAWRAAPMKDIARDHQLLKPLLAYLLRLWFTWMSAAAEVADSTFAVERTTLSEVCSLGGISTKVRACKLRRPAWIQEGQTGQAVHMRHANANASEVTQLNLSWRQAFEADPLAAERAYALASSFGYTYSPEDDSLFGRPSSRPRPTMSSAATELSHPGHDRGRSDAASDVSLIKQESRSTPCVPEQTFGLQGTDSNSNAGHVQPVMYVESGCRGIFRCNGIELRCGFAAGWMVNFQDRVQCSCHHDRNAAAGAPIFHLHFPKCGAAFDVITVEHGGTFSAQHAPLSSDAALRELQAVAAMFREPEERMLSLYAFIRGMGNASLSRTLAHKDMGVSSIERSDLFRAILSGGAPNATVGKFLGCMCNMILGDRCMVRGPWADNSTLAALRAQKAISRLQRFFFVGLTEEWLLSVCLFNYKMTGVAWVAAEQLQVSHKSHAPRPGVGGLDDPIDSLVYRHAAARFRSEIALHNISKSSCIRRRRFDPSTARAWG